MLFCFLGLGEFCCCTSFCFFLRKNLKLSGKGMGEDLEGLGGGKENDQNV